MKIIKFITNPLKYYISGRSKINNENVKDEITDDEIKNKKTMDSLEL